MGQIQSPVYTHGGGEAKGAGTAVKGARAGESFASSAEVKAKRKADAYRTARRKSFAWKPPAKPGLDADWDSFDPDAIAKPPKAAAAPKLTDINKK